MYNPDSRSEGEGRGFLGPGKLPIMSLRLVSATATTTTTDTHSVSSMLGGRKTGKGVKHRMPTTLCYYCCSSSRYLDYKFWTSRQKALKYGMPNKGKQKS